MSTPIYVSGKTSPKARIVNDAYNTPEHVVIATLDRLFQYFSASRYIKILDYGCGIGIWGHHVRKWCPNAKITGFDIQDFTTVTNYYTDYDQLLVCDVDKFLENNTEEYDLIIGNPPYKRLDKLTPKFVHLLEPTHGKLCWLLPLQYLQGKNRFYNTERYLRKVFVYVNRIKWYGKSPHGQHAFYVYQRELTTRLVEMDFIVC